MSFHALNAEPGSPEGADSQIERWRNEIEHVLAAALIGEAPVPAPLQAALQHAVLGGGKRYRGLLALAVGADLMVPAQHLLSSAVALELIHAASLVVDDLPSMDNASRRRAAPATHTVYGEATAILCSIALLARAHECVMRDPELEPVTRARIGEALSAAVGATGLCGGQFDDLFQVENLTESVLSDRYRRKTGALFAASFTCASLIAGADRRDVRRLHEAGERLGIAFQLCDDLLDCLGTADIAGKDVRQDATKVTLATMLGSAAARRLVEIELAAVHDTIAERCGKGYALSLLTSMSARAASIVASA